ncbi:MAG: twin-arginine translocase subunit TatB [Alphaproteobacteria bacterium]|nr:MAG: twin-arginine translocase subunit TatB [Alphaproteobacteria bacterium]
MFDIGWSELVVIAVVALVAIGPKELPGVLRTVGQWIGKARKLAGEFQGQFREAMREAEMADLKKSFDEVKEAATGFTSGHLMTSLEKDVGNALRIEDVDKPAIDAPTTSIDAPTTSTDALATSTDAPVIPTTPEMPIPETFSESDAREAASQPLAIVQEVQPQRADRDAQTAATDVAKDAKAS